MYKSFLALVLCIMLVAAITGCTKADTTNSKEIYIPILAEKSWITSQRTFLNGVHMAVDELNREYSDTGYSVKTAIIDDQGFYDKGVEMATKLAQDEAVTAVLNLQDFDVSKTTSGILSEEEKIVIFPYGAYNSLFQEDSQYLFSSIATSSDLGKKMATYALDKGYKRIAVYHNGSQYQEEIVNAFELALLNSEAKIVDYVPTISSKSEFEGIYSRWRALGVDCVVITQYGLEKAIDVLKIIRNEHQNIPIIGEPVFNAPHVLKENKEAAEGIVVPSTFVIEENENLKVFKEKYYERYQEEADIWAIQGYDMIRLIVDTAVKLDTNDSSEIAKELHSQEGYQATGRTIAFNKGGEMAVDINKLPILKYIDGRFK